MNSGKLFLAGVLCGLATIFLFEGEYFLALFDFSMAGLLLASALSQPKITERVS